MKITIIAKGNLNKSIVLDCNCIGFIPEPLRILLFMIN